jgi:hypothetical protein
MRDCESRVLDQHTPTVRCLDLSSLQMCSRFTGGVVGGLVVPGAAIAIQRVGPVAPPLYSLGHTPRDGAGGGLTCWWRPPLELVQRLWCGLLVWFSSVTVCI